jgi:hypothetical protein
MNDDTLLYWGMIVTVFLMFSAILTAKQLFEMYLEEKDRERNSNQQD